MVTLRLTITTLALLVGCSSEYLDLRGESPYRPLMSRIDRPAIVMLDGAYVFLTSKGYTPIEVSVGGVRSKFEKQDGDDVRDIVTIEVLGNTLLTSVRTEILDHDAWITSRVSCDSYQGAREKYVLEGIEAVLRGDIYAHER